ncbi:MAG TPA: hypothetical protein VJA27_01550 [Patescibacteria group bacterium]|nr:hypothetical protein [Patescibacteria group bacterium]
MHFRGRSGCLGGVARSAAEQVSHPARGGFWAEALAAMNMIRALTHPVFDMGFLRLGFYTAVTLLVVRTLCLVSLINLSNNTCGVSHLLSIKELLAN